MGGFARHLKACRCADDQICKRADSRGFIGTPNESAGCGLCCQRGGAVADAEFSRVVTGNQ